MIRDPLRQPLCLVIDTNLFLLLIAYQCLQLENAKAMARFRVLTEVRQRADAVSPERFEDLWLLFRTAKRRIITQHVVAETYGLRKRLSSFRRQKDLVWKSVILLLTDPGIEEQSCSIRQVYERKEYRSILNGIGPADAGLIYTAEEHGATIVTEDVPLVHWAALRSVPAVLLHQLRGR